MKVWCLPSKSGTKYYSYKSRKRKFCTPLKCEPSQNKSSTLTPCMAFFKYAPLSFHRAQYVFEINNEIVTQSMQTNKPSDQFILKFIIDPRLLKLN